MTTSTFTYPGRMEICALKHYIHRSIVSATTLATKNASYTHRFFSIAYGKVALTELMFHSIKSNERRSLWHSLNYYLVILHHICIKAMQWLSICHHHIVGNVNYVVYRTNAYYVEFFLKPFRTFGNLTACQTNTSITFTSLGTLNFDINRKTFIVNFKCIAARTMETCLIAITFQPRIEITCHSPMRKSIRTIGRDVDFYQPVTLQIIIFCSGCTLFSSIRQNDDTIMACTYAYFIFGTYHTIAFHSA